MCIRDRCNTSDLVGAIQHPEDGYIQPADLTQALATGARNRGAEIYRNTTVVGIKQTKNGWVVETDKGSIECEHVISCSGNFARQTGKMVGLDIPVIPVEHQYIVTEPPQTLQLFSDLNQHIMTKLQLLMQHIFFLYESFQVCIEVFFCRDQKKLS